MLEPLMLKTNVERKGQFTPIPRFIRKQVTRSHCQLQNCGLAYGKIFKDVHGKLRNPKQCLHHLISRRFLAEHGIYEHHPTNLLSICSSPCHGKLLKIEDRLFQGDVIGFLSGMKQCGVPIEKVVHFALSVGLKEFGGLTI